MYVTYAHCAQSDASDSIVGSLDNSVRIYSYVDEIVSEFMHKNIDIVYMHRAYENYEPDLILLIEFSKKPQIRLSQCNQR